MSSRQMRRLQHLVDSSAGADAEVGNVTEEDYIPPTMKPAGADKKKKGQKKTSATTKAIPTPSAVKPAAVSQTAPPSAPGDALMECERPGPAPQIQPVATPVEANTQTSSAATEPKRQTASPKTANAPASLPTQPAAAAAAKKKSRGKKQKAHSDEDDALLEAMLHQREQESAAQANDLTEPDNTDPSHDLLRLLTECDVSRLDTRVERVRAFGPNAVEDYGDNLTTSRMPDGQPRDNGSHSLFPEHHGRFHFKKSVFASPNRYRWPPYDNEDTFLEVVPDAHSDPSLSTSPAAHRPLLFRLRVDTPAFSRAEEARTEAANSHGGVQSLVDSLARFGVYHVPTLLQLRETFQLMNDPLRASEMIDIALYYVGLVLSRFPLARTWRSRQLPFSTDDSDGNSLIHRVLFVGIHVALTRGCMRAAFELNRCVLSLDPDDRTCSLVLLDYTALRAKRWVWLLEVFALLRTVLTDGVYPERLTCSTETMPTSTRSINARHFPDVQAWDTQQTVTRVCTSPGLAFSAALARHMLEREEAVYAVEMQQSGSTAKKPKVLKEMTAEQRELVDACPSAIQMLVLAVQWYPHAAAALVAELGGIETVCKGQAPNALWLSVQACCDAFEPSRDMAPSAQELQHRLTHMGELFAGRAVDMWKAPEVMNFLRLVFTRVDVCEGQNAQQATSSLFDPERAASLKTWLALHHTHTFHLAYNESYDLASIGVIRDDAPTALPMDALNEDAEAEMEERMEELHRLVGAGPGAEELERIEHDALLRYRALYGVTADPDDQGIGQELRSFRERFEAEGGLEENLRHTNALMLAVRAIFPQNTMESMALQHALQTRGIPDPVRSEAAAHRARDVEMWEDDDEAAWAYASQDSEPDNQDEH